jgi:hypothetical protein
MTNAVAAMARSTARNKKNPPIAPAGRFAASLALGTLAGTAPLRRVSIRVVVRVVVPIPAHKG